MSEIETRSAEVTGVRHAERIIDLIAVPYDEWTTVEYQRRMVEESCAPRAFGEHLRPDKFIVNYEHNVEHRVGKVAAFTLDDPAGLRSALRIRRGDEGDQILDDADDGFLGASVGFGVRPEGQQWEGRSRRRIVKAFLDHIALTWTPAYSGARVLAVRSAAPVVPVGPTPNLDSIRLRALEVAYSARQV